MKAPENRFVTRRKALLLQLAQVEPFIEGTLVRIPHKDCRHVAHRLTYKTLGKTRAVYVPLDRVEEVIQWTKAYKRLKRLIRSISEASQRDLRNHVRSRKAARRKSAR